MQELLELIGRCWTGAVLLASTRGARGPVICAASPNVLMMF
jgi:hypothetical protein